MTEEQRQKRAERKRLEYLRNKENPEWLAKRKAYQEKLKADPIYKEKMRLRPQTRRYPYNPVTGPIAMKKYRASEHGKAKTREYKKRVSQTPEARLEARIRTRVCGIFKKTGIEKDARTFELVGCTSMFLRDWIAGQFLPGMSFENRERWHVDHKIPLALAEGEEELKLLCHYSNLQPLWAAENIRKHARHAFESREAAIVAAREAKRRALEITPISAVPLDTLGEA